MKKPRSQIEKNKWIMTELENPSECPSTWTIEKNYIGNVLSGVDTLYISYDLLELNDALLKRLAELKKEAQEKEDGENVVVRIHEKKFIIRPSGVPHYAYVLQNSDYTVKISRSLNDYCPAVYVEIRSEELWSVGVQKAVEEIREFIHQYVGRIKKVDKNFLDRIESIENFTDEEVNELMEKQKNGSVNDTGRSEMENHDDIVWYGEKISRVDFCADFTGVEVDRDTPYQIVSRARKRRVELSGGRGQSIDGISIGRGKLQARIYNKTKEIKQSKKTWFYELWSVPEDTEVWRFEIQLRREALNEFSVDTLEDLQTVAPDIWKYMTEDWLRLAEEDDSNTTRRSLTKWWSEIQQVRNRVRSFFGKLSCAVRDLSRNATLEQLMAMVGGCLSSATAIRQKQSGMEFCLSSSLMWLKKQLIRYFAGIQDKTFLETMADLNFGQQVFEKMPIA